MCEFIDNGLVRTNNEFVDHLNNIETLLQKTTEAVLKINRENSFFGIHIN